MNNTRGVTLTELIVVLAIISVLLLVLLPAVHVARVRSREVICKNNLKQMHIALMQIKETSGEVPKSPPAGQFGGWMIAILPFIEQGNMSRSIEPGARTSEFPAFYRPPSIYVCPAREALTEMPSDRMWPAHYVCTGKWTISDAPLDLQDPWGGSPESSRNSGERTGPHRGGFYFVFGELHGVQFTEGRKPDPEKWWLFN